MKGVYGKPYIDLDNYLNITSLESLFDEMTVGISKSFIDKGVVSCGVHPMEPELELCKVLKKPENYLSSEEIRLLNSLSNLHQKAWFVSLRLPVYHPYFMVFIRRERDFWGKHFEGSCDWTDNAKFFPRTIDFVKSLPFSEVGRIMFFITSAGNRTLVHYDAGDEQARMSHSNTEFIYFRPKNEKKLFVYDEESETKHFVNSYASFWNDLDWHGVDPSEKGSFSMRVDGVFRDEFREKLNEVARRS